jgi:hypothetical protein
MPRPKGVNFSVLRRERAPSRVHHESRNAFSLASILASTCSKNILPFCSRGNLNGLARRISPLHFTPLSDPILSSPSSGSRSPAATALTQVAVLSFSVAQDAIRNFQPKRAISFSDIARETNTCRVLCDFAPMEIRTPVLALKGPRPGPLDDGGDRRGIIAALETASKARRSHTGGQGMCGQSSGGAG